MKNRITVRFALDKIFCSMGYKIDVDHEHQKTRLITIELSRGIKGIT